MRLAYICGDPGVPVFGRKGCSIHVQEVVRALRRLGVEVELFAVKRGGEAPEDLREVRVHDLRLREVEERGAREAVLQEANEEWRWQLERAGTFDVVYERYSLWSTFALEHARRIGIPALLEVNAPLIEEQAAHRGLVDPSAADRCARRGFAAATVLLAVSEEVGEYLQRFPESGDRVRVLPNGVDVTRFDEVLQRRNGRVAAGNKAGLTVGFVGTLKPWHGVDRLVEAFAMAALARPSLKLLIVGDGPERERLEGHARAWGVDRVTIFTGAVEASAVPQWLGQMDIAVAPYPRLDRFYFSPLKVYEYMAAGLPVVASRIGQLERVMEHGVNGLLVEPGDKKALAAALVMLADHAGLRRGMGVRARATVEENHTWASVAMKILGLASRHDAARGPEARGQLVGGEA
ncbi:MAG: glycosyltransferase family 4 protein [Verrucomicrobiales bacterium]|nr:glycosyltransferase family 4 protein [Verrucomicrobiales bacterium]